MGNYGSAAIDELQSVSVISAYDQQLHRRYPSNAIFSSQIFWWAGAGVCCWAENRFSMRQKYGHYLVRNPEIRIDLNCFRAKRSKMIQNLKDQNPKHQRVVQDMMNITTMAKMTLKRPTAALLFFTIAGLLLVHDVTSFAPQSSPAVSSLSQTRTPSNHHVKIANPSTTHNIFSPTTHHAPPTTTALHLTTLPSWTYYSLAHLIGGTTGTPIVMRGTKKGSWFDRIPKPNINPPNYVFGPVWTVLYSLMGVSVSRIIKASSSTSATQSLAVPSSLVLKLWYGHYTLNLLWAPIFFGLQKFRLGFIISSLLVLTLGGILPLYHAIDPIAAYLQLPYFMWLCFATLLNYQFCQLNPLDGSGMNEAMRQADLVQKEKKSGGEYTEERFQSDLKELQRAAGLYAGL